MISIEMFPAGNGDTILLGLDDTYILIDGGYTSTYRDHLKPRLAELSRAGKRLSKFVVTHIDADHITGAMSFIEENGNARNPAIIPIDEVWFNSYRHLQFKEKEHGTLEKEPPQLGPRAKKSIEADAGDSYVSFDQGSSLGSLLLQNEYAWNTSFNGKAVKTDAPTPLKMGDEVLFTILGPTTDALDKLGDDWRKSLMKLYDGKINDDSFFDDAFEGMTLAAHQAETNKKLTSTEKLVAGGRDWIQAESILWKTEDSSLPNGSSITFLIEYKGKKITFPGDAIPSHVLPLIKNNFEEGGKPFSVDVLKVAHHGAWPNNNPELFDHIQAQYYLISTNGFRHRHPHLSTLASIIQSNGNPSQKNIVFNYRQRNRFQHIDIEEIKNKYNFKCFWPDVDEFGQGKDGYYLLTI
ncbi:MAG: MBL fold metallo-hydrolase [Saprospiraceae bacterium]|uniref:MBL fold metallo-hydrolase n=1 Tax=Candidatus Opimibacter skivensis TaxID=2982028 RepID=A0A9D7SW99_9BACT|nr:MBL fold metallo-hydrolase [Candidatus Opimibacter skivensis]